MQLETMIEVLYAAHLSYRVQSRFPSRGGLFLVSPPGHLKTSVLNILNPLMGVVGFSDIQSNNLAQAREQICGNKITTLLLYDVQKIFERRIDTAYHIMGNLRAMMDEGFTSVSQENMSDQLITRRARALVIGACTPTFVQTHFNRWVEDGFQRRVLFSHYVLKNPERIKQAIMDDRPIQLPGIGWMPANLVIEYKPAKIDESFLLGLLRKQREDVPLILLRKILAVLRWKYDKLRKKNKAYEILEDFRESLIDEGAEVTI